MKRKIVQHGPSTLTVSLPSDWVKEYRIKKGDEITLERFKGGLFLSAGKGVHHGQKSIDVSGMAQIIPKAIAALYKHGYDEIIVTYSSPDELEQVHKILSTGYIGFEIVEETKDRIYIRKVSEPAEEEFKTLFRRIFHFLLSLADDGIAAARAGDKEAYRKLVLRDQNINKLADFCRRLVNKRMQSDYGSETAIYHVIEQLEKIGDAYKEINQILMEHGKLSSKGIEAYEATNDLLRRYDDLFFRFTLEKANAFIREYRKYEDRISSLEDQPRSLRIIYLLESIGRELYNLTGATMILYL